MKKNSLENQWKATLRKAEMPPPLEIWENIEQTLDNDLSLDNTFQETFEHASELPDADVWSSIASALDKQEKRKPVFFLWFNKYAGAGIAALLLMVLGFSVFNSSDLFEDQFSSGSQLKSKAESLAKSDLPDVKEGSELTENSTATGDQTDAFTIENTFENEGFGASIPQKSSTIQIQLESKNELVNNKFGVFGTEEAEISERSLVAKLGELSKIDFYEFANSFILTRPKLPYETPDEFENNNNQTFLQRSWFGLISGLSPFDPNFKINNFERALASNDVPRNVFEFNNLADQNPNPIKRETFAIPLSQPYSTVRSGSGINFGFDYGKRIGKHFSWQGGIRYMSGRSLVESNVYSYNERTGKVRTFLESNYIRQDISAFDNTIISSSGFVDNDYKYLMLPMQMAIHVPVSQKLEVALSSGVSADFLVNNVLDNIPEGGSKLNAKNSAYKVVNLSGIGSVKMNYMVGQNWQLSVGTNVQQTLTSGVEKAEGFSFKPRYIGLNTGINYRFN